MLKFEEYFATALKPPWDPEVTVAPERGLEAAEGDDDATTAESKWLSYMGVS